MKLFGVDFTGFLNDVYKIEHDGQVILKFDSIRENEIERTSILTRYPIERGYQNPDYKYIDPATISMVGIISGNRFVDGLLGKNIDDMESLINEQLEKYLEGIFLLTIYTRSTIRQNMTLVSYRITENAQNFGLFEVTMDFEEILIFDTTQNITEANRKPTQSAGIVQTEVIQ